MRERSGEVGRREVDLCGQVVEGEVLVRDTVFEHLDDAAAVRVGAELAADSGRDDDLGNEVGRDVEWCKLPGRTSRSSSKPPAFLCQWPQKSFFMPAFFRRSRNW